MSTYKPVTSGNRLMLAVDPGGVTGWLLFRPVVDTDLPGGIGIEPVEWGEEPDQLAFCDQVWKWKTARLVGERLDGIVCEAWTPRPGVRTWEPEAVELIGTMRWLARDPASFFLQSVGDAKAFGTPAKIDKYRRENVLPYNVGRGGAGHAVMALRHAVLWSQTRWSPA